MSIFDCFLKVLVTAGRSFVVPTVSRKGGRSTGICTTARRRIDLSTYVSVDIESFTVRAHVSCKLLFLALLL